MASNPLGPGDSRLTKVVIKSSLITSTIPYKGTRVCDETMVQACSWY